jgi:valyl-tRNA synthetase
LCRWYVPAKCFEAERAHTLRIVRNRMLGKTTLFLPGFDHGGISTESVVQKRLYTKTGQTRRSLGREALLSALHDWTNESVSHALSENNA